MSPLGWPTTEGACILTLGQAVKNVHTDLRLQPAAALLEEVLQVLCEADDWISVPAGTKHWFDMGAEPSFCAIRFFDNPEGWVAQFSGDPIADRFPRLS